MPASTTSGAKTKRSMRRRGGRLSREEQGDSMEESLHRGGSMEGIGSCHDIWGCGCVGEPARLLSAPRQPCSSPMLNPITAVTHQQLSPSTGSGLWVPSTVQCQAAEWEAAKGGQKGSRPSFSFWSGMLDACLSPLDLKVGTRCQRGGEGSVKSHEGLCSAIHNFSVCVRFLCIMAWGAWGAGGGGQEASEIQIPPNLLAFACSHQFHFAKADLSSDPSKREEGAGSLGKEKAKAQGALVLTC